MLNREDILKECFERCMTEMYKYAQPSLDYLSITDMSEEEKKKLSYKHYYLSDKNCKFIIEHYLYIYGLFDWWKESVEVIERDFTKGGLKDHWVKESTDKYGKHPGYRDTEKVPPLKDIIGEENSNKVLSILKDYKDFYRFGRRDLDSISFSLYNYSPNSNKQTVIDYWKTQGKDITIDDFDVEDKIYGTDDEEEE